MYKSVFPPEKYTWFSKNAFSFSNRGRNIATWEKADLVLGNHTLAAEFTILEDHFVGAALCYQQLRYRKEKYEIAVDSDSVLGDINLKTMHAYEHYFISTCGYIDKSLTLMQRYGTIKFPKQMLDQLKQLRLERVAKEHSQEWSFGELNGNERPIPTKGDNYDFEKNMILLDKIYDFIIEKIKTE